MSLSDLAALAVEHVPEFERPTRACGTCGGYGDATPGWHFTKCECEAGDGREWDNSSPALLMAVFEHQLKGARKLETDRGDILIRHGVNWSRVKAGETQESIAHAALVALLRANGVEVADG